MPEKAAAEVLGGQSNLPESILTAVAVRLEDNDSSARRAAAIALGHQPNVPESILIAVAARLEDNDRIVQKAAVMALGCPIKPPRIYPHSRGGSAGG